MTHIATLYTYHEGREKPNLIRYFWDQDTLSLYTQDEYLIDGIQCPENPVQQDPNTNIWNVTEALLSIAGTADPGIYDMGGLTVVVYERRDDA